MTPQDRTGIYYWKCDRASAFHGVMDYLRDQGALLSALRRALASRYGGRLADLRVASEGQGNHRTFRATLDGCEVFIRVEDGPEGDNYLAVEAEVTRRVAGLGVPVPATLAYDCSRREVPFAWQVAEYCNASDLNVLQRRETMDWPSLARDIGKAVATWQAVTADGFGPFSARAAEAGELRGVVPSYEAYYRLHLDRHLQILVRGGLVSADEAARVRAVVERHAAALALERGVLVHKDLALWNMLGTSGRVESFIDWDDCILGDGMDDLSLLGVTGDDAVTKLVLEAYAACRPLADGAATRFWMCWLRNILFKAVIRQEAGYFAASDRSFFLLGGGTGRELAARTRQKIEQALVALEGDVGFEALGSAAPGGGQ